MSNESFNSFENELRRLRPAVPAARLAHSIESALAADRERVSAPSRVPPLLRVSLWASWCVAASAAAVAVTVVLREAPPAPDLAERERVSESAAPVAPRERSAFPVVPVGSSGMLLDAQDEGIVFLDGGIPARRVRYQFLDNVELRAPGGRGTVNVSYPRDEIRVIPINTY